MPINADYEFINAQKKYDEAKTTEEKVAALELMRSTCPGHKGAEKLRIDISKRLTKMKEKLEQEKQRKGGSKTMTVKKDGACQVVLVGLPNSGKSTLLKAITNANPIIAPYEFTTIEPEVGIMDYKGAQIQIVEIPALIEGSISGKARGREKIGVIRNADFIIFTLIGSFQEIKKHLDLLTKELESSGIKLNKQKPAIFFKKTGTKGVDVIGKQYLKADLEKVAALLQSYGMSNVILELQENADLKKIEEAIDSSIAYKKAVAFWIYGNESFNYKELKVVPINPNDSDKIKETIYKDLDLIIVYTRKPGEKDEDSIPVVLQKGSNVEKLCEMLHKDFLDKFNYARVWGSAKFPGQVVSKNFKLKEKDIIEITLKR